MIHVGFMIVFNCFKYSMFVRTGAHKNIRSQSLKSCERSLEILSIVPSSNARDNPGLIPVL